MINRMSLNETQREAIEYTEGAVLVFAGAGSGKTRVLTNRVIHLVEDLETPAWQVLAITFTNKATNEMKNRLEDMMGPNEVWVSTFHSLCMRILFKYADRLGYAPNFSVFDEAASRRVVQRVLRELNMDEKDKERYRYHITAAKSLGFNPAEYVDFIGRNGKNFANLREVYERYEQILKENNAMDFDDLLMKCVYLLQTVDEAREYYQNRFRYIHVDEFQDTNEIQMELLKILAAKWGNIFVVGDDDQSIYGWRGANVKNILEFDKAFPYVRIFKLEENYRSTQQILDAANRLIKHNKSRSDKELYSQKKDGVRVEYIFSPNEYNEVDNVLDRIVGLKRNQGYVNSDFAILVRNNALTRLFEKSLNTMRIPYRVYGGFKFFERKEILDIIAYLRLVVNPSDGEALTRIINFPRRGIGDTTVDALERLAAEKKVPIGKIISDIRNIPDVSVAIKARILAFSELIDDLRQTSVNLDLEQFIQYLVDKVGFIPCYRASAKEEDASRVENIEEFLKFIRETHEENPDLKLPEFLQNFALNNDRVSGEGMDDEDYVTLATMHSAKGLEFRAVFIVACEEGIIPSAMSLAEPNGIEEERRVMYVAMTRAQERLYISCVKGVRRRFNKDEFTVPSRFIAESRGEEFVVERKDTYKRDAAFGKRDSYSTAIPGEDDMRLDSSYQPQIFRGEQKKVYNTSAEGFVSGAKVKHKKYGIGTVIIVDGSGAGTTVTVVFKNLGLKKFALMNAPLELVKPE